MFVISSSDFPLPLIYFRKKRSKSETSYNCTMRRCSGPFANGANFSLDTCKKFRLCHQSGVSFPSGEFE